MKIKAKTFIYLIFAILPCLAISAAQLQPSSLETLYLPIKNYEIALSKMLAKLWQQRNEKVQDPIVKHEEKAPLMLSRQEALDKIQEISTNLFDTEHINHLSVYLNEMRTYCDYLDPFLDKKTIDAIIFLLENQHRSNYTDSFFWMKAIKEKDLHTAIPMDPAIINKSNLEKLAIIRKKMIVPIENIG